MDNLELLNEIEAARIDYIKELIKIATNPTSSATAAVSASRALESIYRELREGNEDYYEGLEEEIEATKVITI